MDLLGYDIGVDKLAAANLAHQSEKTYLKIKTLCLPLASLKGGIWEL